MILYEEGPQQQESVLVSMAREPLGSDTSDDMLHFPIGDSPRSQSRQGAEPHTAHFLAPHSVQPGVPRGVSQSTELQPIRLLKFRTALGVSLGAHPSWNSQ